MLTVLEGVQLSSTYASIVFRVNVVNQMAAPTGGDVEEVRDLTNDTDVESTVMPSGSVTVEDTSYVKFPALTALTAGRRYSIRFSFTDGTNTLPGEILVDCKF